MTKQIFYFIVLATIMMNLFGCGQSGPLYLPEHNSDQKKHETPSFY